MEEWIENSDSIGSSCHKQTIRRLGIFIAEVPGVFVIYVLIVP